MSDVTIVWFRRDLRLSDNPALLAAAKQGAVLPVYILDESPGFQIGGASKWWLHHSLAVLDKALDGKLVLFRGDTENIIPQLARDAKAKAVHWNACFEPAFVERDAAIRQHLQQRNIACTIGNGSHLWHPDETVKKDGTPYKVYTPFLRAALAKGAPPRPKRKPSALTLVTKKPPGAVTLQQLKLLPTIPWDAGIAQAWTPGEDAAQKTLKTFITRKLPHYGANRNFPARDVLSRLSPHLHYGEISPHQVWHAAFDASRTVGEPDGNVQKFISELCWREFSAVALYHFPDTATDSYNTRLKKLKWAYNAALLKTWQSGQTGIPIVDAGMRQLWQTGYMHNRVRMIAASFLVKNLLMDWRTGADWFMDCLVDADLAVNTMNWQWVAGSGLDAAPFFRIFNPVLQSKKFDAQADYIKTYVPELNALPAKHVHAPWAAPARALQQANIELGRDYPKPCVDLKESSQAALTAYRKTA